MRQLQAHSAIDGQWLGEFTVTDAAQISQQLTRARRAGAAWQQTPLQRRLQQLAPLNALLLARADDICQLLSISSGKVMTEALLAEIIPVLDLNRYYQQHAAAILKPQAVSCSPLSFPFATAAIERRPYGVVAIISPWNYPFQLSLSPLLTALIAGNAVLLKVSELSLPVADLILQLCQQLDLPADLVQLVTGDGETGRQLIAAGPDLVFFTGSLATGRAVMQAAAQHPVPVLLELGGKDAMLVFADADLQRACQAALYGAFSNSGQVCMSIERLYVENNCFSDFLAQLQTALAALTLGHGDDGDLGSLCSEAQWARIQNHYQDALAKGASASGPLIRQGNYLQPVILWNVSPEMLIMQEETFGPLLPVLSFETPAQVIAMSNDCDYGLNGSIWSRDINKARQIAAQLQLGNWAINDVIKNGGHAGLPFGGVKKSGFGRYRGGEGLRQFTYTVSGLTNRSRLSTEPNWFPYNQQRYHLFKSYIDFVYGPGNFLQRISRNWRAILAFRQYAMPDLRQNWHNFLQLLPWKRDY